MENDPTPRKPVDRERQYDLDEWQKTMQDILIKHRADIDALRDDFREMREFVNSAEGFVRLVKKAKGEAA